ncbi:MAG: bifunctional adenosylcobinamide kinase/adenosylcobinamide-phosphate guanylyltransferase [Lachnospiraceae bacterium]|nr:bifunctional adenosylcobinamide kinase/adenosylcobinamide-phosphate guanylyltransferase [Lachnospiraceae bacterium]
MRLIIGGAYQGKLDYAKKTYGIEDGWIDGRDCGWMEITTCRGIHHFHEYVKRMIQAEPKMYTADGQQIPEAESDTAAGNGLPEFVAGSGADSGSFFRIGTDDLTLLEEQAQDFSAWLFQRNPEIIIVSNELGYGIVPMEKNDRLWRETVGRICTCLAAEANEVVRVVCGIGGRLK